MLTPDSWVCTGVAGGCHGGTMAPMKHCQGTRKGKITGSKGQGHLLMYVLS